MSQRDNAVEKIDEIIEKLNKIKNQIINNDKDLNKIYPLIDSYSSWHQLMEDKFYSVYNDLPSITQPIIKHF